MAARLSEIRQKTAPTPGAQSPSHGARPKTYLLLIVPIVLTWRPVKGEGDSHG